MKLDKKHMLLYAICDRGWAGERGLYKQVKEALKSGITCLQLREKNLDEEEFLKEAREISALCREYNVPFIINDNVKIAIACNADGVHIGQEDMDLKTVRKLVGEDMIIGVSVHNVNEAKKAKANGADYIGIGAIFKTSTKSNVHALSPDELKSICKVSDIPKVAIGGINKDNILKLKGSGIDGVALISAIFGADDIKKSTEELLKLVKDIVE